MVRQLKTLRFLALLLLFLAGGDGAIARVRTGIEVLLEDSLACISGRRLGLVTNQTGIDGQGRSTVMLLHGHPRVNLIRLFSPEHGLDGSRPAGELVKDEEHAATGLPVTSLYQGQRAVDPALFDGLDLVLFDIQDIGIRPYTYTSTLAEVMKAVRAAGIEVLVLDRPNPLGGQLVAGLTLDPAFSSFIGPYPIPYLHGMTIGELALLFNDAFGIGCRLRVIPLSGWTRDMCFPRTGLPWVPTSPNVPTWDTPWAMCMTGPVGELGSTSIGIGSPSPFWVAGTDQLDADRLAWSFNAANLPGMRAMPWHWTPSAGSWNGKRCHGIRLLVLDMAVADPCLGQLVLLEALLDQVDSLMTAPTELQRGMFNKALGTDRILQALREWKSLDDVRNQMLADRKAWRVVRAPYLIYR